MPNVGLYASVSRRYAEYARKDASTFLYGSRIHHVKSGSYP